MRQVFLSTEDVEIIGWAEVTEKMSLTIEIRPPDGTIGGTDNAPDSGLSLANRIKQVTPNISDIVLIFNTDDAQFFKALKCIHN
ncbi:MAG: hypothetical protein CL873_02980 [Dehalococcoidales bacterium]|jgi:hypothetical protein|nr:hypothetical protein [Dehalococcoidales bacterium]|tara:strand:- start:77 stop:328 length:252 start_codon:yes stop_codon:yes gene_type:complete